MKKILLMIILLITPMILSACQENEIADIYVTIYPVKFIVEEIVQDELTVQAIYPQGQDVHDYELSIDNILDMKKGKAIFYIGLGLEPFIESAKDTTLKDNKLVALSDGVTLTSKGDGHNHSGNEASYNYDEHIWLDPLNMVLMVNTAVEALVQVMPECEEKFRENAASLCDKLNALHQKYTEALNDDTIAHKVIMVDHDAYAYWTSRYQIERIKLRSSNEATEVTVQEFDGKVNLAKEYGIKYILATKNEAKCKMFNNYIEHLGAKEEELHHLGSQTKAEADGLEGDDFLNYFTIMEYNLKVLLKVLPRKTN